MATATLPTTAPETTDPSIPLQPRTSSAAKTIAPKPEVDPMAIMTAIAELNWKQTFEESLLERDAVQSRSEELRSNFIVLDDEDPFPDLPSDRFPYGPAITVVRPLVFAPVTTIGRKHPVGLAIIKPSIRSLCEAPGDEDLIQRVAGKLLAMAETSNSEAAELNEDGNVGRVLACFADIIAIVPAYRKVACGGAMHFEEGRWQMDRTGWVYKVARAVLRAMVVEKKGIVRRDPKTPKENTPEAWKKANEAADAEYKAKLDAIDDWAKKCQSVARVKSVVEGLAFRVGRSETDFDGPRTDSYLNTPDGTYDLVTDQLIQPHDPALLITQTTEMPLGSGDCPQFKAALLRWMNGDQALVDYLMHCVGASFSPALSSRKLFVLHGKKTGNGKSTFLKIIAGVGGDYVGTIAAKALMAQQAESSHDEHLAGLLGKRFVYAVETKEGQTFDKGLIKGLTGRDAVRLRRIMMESKTVRSTWTIWLCTNEVPRIDGLDDAMRARIYLIPWDVQIADGSPEDPIFAEKIIDAEGPEILAYILQSMREVRDNPSLLATAPERAAAATDEYFAAEDIIGRFLDEKCYFDDRAKEAPTYGATQIHASMEQIRKGYTTWCDASGFRPERDTKLAERLTGRGCARKAMPNGSAGYVGVMLKADANAYGLMKPAAAEVGDLAAPSPQPVPALSLPNPVSSDLSDETRFN